MEEPSSHPYHPPSALIRAYVPNNLPLGRLLPPFGGLVSAVVISAYLLAARSRTGTGNRRGLRPIDRFAAPWFALCGFLHVAFEGYYIYHRSNMPGMNTFFAQLWKEYALSDSRYLTSDVFTVCVESITVFVWGPLSLLTVLAILTSAPSRHIYQVIVCTAHLYGVALYYATNWTEHRFNGVSYSRPEFLYFWIYYVGFNLPWAIVPLGLLADSYNQTVEAFRALHEKESRQKRD